MVCLHWQGQSAQRVENAVWCLHLPGKLLHFKLKSWWLSWFFSLISVKRIFFRSQLWHFIRQQVHCYRFGWQKSYCLRSHLLILSICTCFYVELTKVFCSPSVLGILIESLFCDYFTCLLSRFSYQRSYFILTCNWLFIVCSPLCTYNYWFFSFAIKCIFLIE